LRDCGIKGFGIIAAPEFSPRVSIFGFPPFLMAAKIHSYNSPIPKFLNPDFCPHLPICSLSRFLHPLFPIQQDCGKIWLTYELEKNGGAMKKLLVRGTSGSSRLLVGESIENLNQYIDPQRTMIITDSTVAGIYGEKFPDACPVISIGPGEKIKTLETVSEIYSQLVELEADRSNFILGIGGGIVCDIAGFVASTYMRGMRFGFVATTLLAQVDASVGGKNGVNFGGFKNMVGVFNQPEFVICDLAMLKSLPVREVLCGFAEIIKHGAIADSRMLDFMETHQEGALDLDLSVIEYLVYRSAEIKAGVVTRDERESGERRKLNFGHTFGHAIEKLTGIPHGEAVGIGMVLAARLSVEKGLLQPREADRLERIIAGAGLPVAPPVDLPDMLAAVRKDKKRQGERIHFVFLEKLGSCLVEEISLAELQQRANAVAAG
jgi:3-dehydroquinate synthase